MPESKLASKSLHVESKVRRKSSVRESCVKLPCKEKQNNELDTFSLDLDDEYDLIDSSVLERSDAFDWMKTPRSTRLRSNGKKPGQQRYASLPFI